MRRPTASLAPLALALSTVLAACGGASTDAPAGAAASDAGATGPALSPATAAYDPSRALGPLFHDVQLAGIFPDSKTFVDARPRDEPARIVAAYDSARRTPGFDLRAFVLARFELPAAAGAGFVPDSAAAMEAHVRALWPALTRAADRPDPRSSLLPLPHPYVVPGGRFREVYYWDSYFTMVGLLASGRQDLVRHMLDNFAHLVRTVGHVPNANRTYYLSRSQPPYLAAMVGLYAAAVDTADALRWLDALEREHAFWMDGAERLAPGQAHRRVVRLADGTLLNRYWDDRAEPRPESYREDWRLVEALPDSARRRVWRELRAAAESGWDFSSRWMRDPKDLRTLETTELVPVDLNALLVHAEETIAALRAHRGRMGDAEASARWALLAETRKAALRRVAWDPTERYFFDVRWRTGARVTDRPSLAATAPLYFGLATPEQGQAVAARLEREFLRPGGFATTGIASGQQWDAPNGWPPLQWLAIRGARRYQAHALADTATARWTALNRRTYATTRKMTEKYDVADLARRAGGGEYPNQDGFGWTNGVALGLSVLGPRPFEMLRLLGRGDRPTSVPVDAPTGAPTGTPAGQGRPVPAGAPR